MKILLGNPSKEHIPPEEPSIEVVQLPPLTSSLEQLRPIAPDYLTPAEALAFDTVIALLPPGIARKTDAHAFARWAHWLMVWIEAKKLLQGRAHWYERGEEGEKRYIEHPIYRRQLQAEEILSRLEDRLALNIAARNQIIHRLFSMPHQLPGPPPLDPAISPNVDGAPSSPTDESPLGFLARAGKLH